MDYNLFTASPGNAFIVSDIPSGHDWLKRFGIAAGEELVLLSRSGCGVTVRIKGIKYALGRSLAQKIPVRAKEDILPNIL